MNHVFLVQGNHWMFMVIFSSWGIEHAHAQAVHSAMHDDEI